MSLNDRLALEIGRAILRAVAAEDRIAEIQAASTPPAPPAKKGKRKP